MPSVELPPAIPLTLQVTPGAGLPEAKIAAEKICSPPPGTLAEAGETVTTILSVRLTAADALAELSAALTAVTVMLGDRGIVPGAV